MGGPKQWLYEAIDLYHRCLPVLELTDNLSDVAMVNSRSGIKLAGFACQSMW